MMNDIVPPRPPQKRLDNVRLPPPSPTLPQGVSEVKRTSEDNLLPDKDQVAMSPPQRSRRVSLMLAMLLGSLLLVGLGGGAGALWYVNALRPVNPADASRQQFKVTSGATATSIGRLLAEKGLIRSEAAFSVHTRLSGARSRLQAGNYNLSPSESLSEIVTQLTKGRTEQISVTFYPGAILRDLLEKDDAKRTDVTTVLRRAGYEEAEITQALSAPYDHPLFAEKPAGTGLEGYVYGETYFVSSESSAEQVLKGTFDEFYELIEQNDLKAKFERQNLNLYQGITLASIVEREVKSGEDRRLVAGIFLRRLEIGMTLGSDVTYEYAARQLGVPATPSLDSPYNTRKFAGLPPGPIAVPGKDALFAVAEPIKTDNLFFLSGDDGKTYFARTVAEHERNIRDYCKVMCQ